MSVPTTISAIVLTNRRHEELDGALANLINQDRQPDEIIVIDLDPAGSGKAAPRVTDPLVHYHCPKTELTMAAARNLALERAKGEILLFLEEDARFEKYSATHIIMEVFRDPKFAGLSFLVRDSLDRQIIQREYPGTDLRRWDEPHRISYFAGCAFATRRAVLEQFGGFDEAFTEGEEHIDLAYRMDRANLEIHFMPTILLYHRLKVARIPQLPATFRMVRNRTYLAMKHFPLPLALNHAMMWNIMAIFEALRTKTMGDYTRGFKALWTEGLLARAKGYRKANPPGWSFVAFLSSHDARIWY